jgi:hypothetical protein
MGLSFHFPMLWRTNGSRKWRDINREKVNNKEGNNHAKNSEHEHIIPSDNRPQTAAYGLLP